MAWDPTPFLIGGGAVHSPEVVRANTFALSSGVEGVLGADDLKVTALSPTSGAVRVLPGACLILNRAASGGQQTYSARNPTADVVNIAPTSSVGGRSDLVIARVEDPFMQGEPWAKPSDPTTAQYVFTRVITGVSASTTSVASLGLGYSAIALARIDIPANTTAITDAMIVPLRKVARPRASRQFVTHTPSTSWPLTAAAYGRWIGTATWQVPIPPWASYVTLRADVTGARVDRLNATTNGMVYGAVRAVLGTLRTGGTTFDVDAPAVSTSSRVGITAGGTLAIPAAMRGTTVEAFLEGVRSSGNVPLSATTGTTIFMDFDFTEQAD